MASASTSASASGGNLFASLEDRVAAFVKSSAQFRRIASESFEAFESRGAIGAPEAGECVEVVFERVQDYLSGLGVKVTKPTPQEVNKMFQETLAPGASRLDKAAFEEFFLRLVKSAVAISGRAFAQKYGAGIVAATAAIMILKRTLRAVPLIGLFAAPLLALAPTLLVGPVIGIAVVYGLERGDLAALRRKLFPRHQAGRGGAAADAE